MNVTRRELIRLGAGAAAAGLTGPWTTLLASEAKLITTTIPSSEFMLPPPLLPKYQKVSANSSLFRCWMANTRGNFWSAT